VSELLNGCWECGRPRGLENFSHIGGFHEILEACREYYKTHSTGGHLHIALDDGNVEAHFVGWCAVMADRAGDVEGVTLALSLLRLSESQRWSLYRKLHEVAS
jgi:hypothetical protein